MNFRGWKLQIRLSYISTKPEHDKSRLLFNKQFLHPLVLGVFRYRIIVDFIRPTVYLLLSLVIKLLKSINTPLILSTLQIDSF